MTMCVVGLGSPSTTRFVSKTAPCARAALEVALASQATTRTFALNNQNQKDSIIDAVKISCRKITKEITGKKPLTSIKLIRI